MEISAKVIQKYAKFSTSQLRQKAGKVFRAWIRKRDEGQPCISCGHPNPTDAGHFYSSGHYPELEFDPMNVHLQCKRCNLFLSGNLNEYRKNLPARIGDHNMIQLDLTVDIHKKTGYKHDRFFLIEVIEYYK